VCRPARRLCVGLLARELEARPAGKSCLTTRGQVSASESAQVFAVAGPSQQFACGVHERTSDASRSHRGRSGTAVTPHAGFVPAARGRVVVLHGRCREREAVPYKGVDAVIDSLSAYLRNLPIHAREQLCPSDLDALVRVFPVLDEIWDEGEEQLLGLNEARSLGWATLRKLLEAVAERQPIVMHIDDFQWPTRQRSCCRLCWPPSRLRSCCWSVSQRDGGIGRPRRCWPMRCCAR
jgi:hypothetical protein